MVSFETELKLAIRNETRQSLNPCSHVVIILSIILNKYRRLTFVGYSMEL